MLILLVYILGIASGFALAVAWGMVLEAREREKLKSKVEKLVTEIKKEMIWASAKQRFDQVLKINEQQNDLIGAVEGPSRGALFSKWRNDKRGQLLELEREKMDIFRSILKDGLDPLVNVMGDDGEVTKKKMSETVAEFDQRFPKENVVKLKEVAKTPALKIVKFPENPHKS